MTKPVILFLAANPGGTDRLALDEECAAIERELAQTLGRDDFDFRSKWAVGVDELMRHLNTLQPTVIHFAGHGDADGLLLRGEDGQLQAVSADALTLMVASAGRAARLIVLNACYSDAQANALRDAVDCVVGMTGQITDEAAHSFAVGFYRALGHRRSVGNAFDQAVATLAGKGLRAEAAPRCLTRPGVDAAALVLGTRADLHPSGDQAIAAWKAAIVDETARLPLLGSDDRHVLALDELYVPLHVDFNPPSWDEPRSPHKVGLDEAVKAAEQRPRPGLLPRVGLVLLGEPGAGKSTLLRQIYRRVALGGGSQAVGFPSGLEPVLLHCGEVPLDHQGAGGALATAVERAAERAGHAGAGTALVASKRPLLFLLDSLDEIADHRDRAALCSLLESEVSRWHGSRFVVACRLAAWEARARLDNRFLRVYVQQLDDDAIALYVRKYLVALRCAFLAGGFEAQEQAAIARAAVLVPQLLALFASRSRRTIVENPLLLAQICIVCDAAGSDLPRSRRELHDRCLRALLETVPAERAERPALPYDDARLILQPLAWAMQGSGETSWPVDAVEREVADPLGEVTSLRHLAPADFVQRVTHDCGVLSRRGPVRRFSHLSFQEYLAASHAHTGRLADHLAVVAGEPRWREVILLAAAEGGFAAFVTALAEQGTLARHEGLVRECAAEATRIEAAPLLRLIDRGLGGEIGGPAAVAALLLAIGTHAPPKLVERARELSTSEHRALAAAARTVVGVEIEPSDRIAVPGRNFRLAITGQSFLWVAPGTFWKGATKSPGHPAFDPDAFDDEMPPHRVQVPGFWIAELPVTNRDYRVYLDTGSAADEPYFWRDPRFNGDDQPVVGVSWEQARAYCAWLHASTTLPDDVELRLPTESEWEFAARGPGGSKYPWGDQPPTSVHADFRQDYETGRPAPVGTHPQGRSLASGALDMAGGVWEWCLDAWADYAGRVDDQLDDGQRGDADTPRVARGSAWDFHEGRNLRGAFRIRFLPRFRNLAQGLGFRVVCGGPRRPDGR